MKTLNSFYRLFDSDSIVMISSRNKIYLVFSDGTVEAEAEMVSQSVRVRERLVGWSKNTLEKPEPFLHFGYATIAMFDRVSDWCAL